MSLQLFDQQGVPVAAWPVADRAWQYGDGVFRTALVQGGEIQDLQGQLAHLRRDATQLGLLLEPHLTQAELASRSINLAAQYSTARLRWVITAGDSDAGYARAAEFARLVFAITILADDYQPPEQLDCSLCATRWGLTMVGQGCKHLNRLEQVWARRELAPGLSEGLVCDSRGCLCSGTMSNLFWWGSDEVLRTHPLQDCGVRGRTRARVIAWAKNSGQPLEFAEQEPARVFADAQEIFVCNSLWGIVPLRSSGSWAPPAAQRGSALRRFIQQPVAQFEASC